MPHHYSIEESKDKLSREPIWLIVRDGKRLGMAFYSPTLAKEFLDVLEKDDARKNVGAKRSAA